MRWALALIFLARTAFGQPAVTTQAGAVRFLEDGTFVGARKTVNCAAGITCSDNPGQSRMDVTATGGAGFGTIAPLGLSTCMAIDGSVTNLFMSLGTCVDATEAMVATKVDRAATLANLNCKASANVGATVTVTMRSGACSGALADSSLACTIGSGTNTCDSGVPSLLLGAGDCLSARVTSAGALGAGIAVNCTVEPIA